MTLLSLETLFREQHFDLEALASLTRAGFNRVRNTPKEGAHTLDNKLKTTFLAHIL